MNIRPGSSFRKSLFLIFLFLGTFFAFGAGTLLTVHAQKGEPGGLSSMTTVNSNGRTLERYTINAPPHPPASFDIKSTVVTLPEPGQYSAITALNVPAYDWVFGCSSVSGAMIAGYYDLHGYPNMYTGPANGGNAPMDNSTTYWPGWSDGVTSYPNLPLAASHQGIDGRSAGVRGSIDDYWVQYGSGAQDPYITGPWAPHTRSDAIGDYMGTSQSATPYLNTDGSSAFYNYSDAAKLNCNDMVTASDPRLGVLVYQRDATYGRKLFYEARGYSVTDCYNQVTDNKATGGFSYAQYKAEIDAGRPVMLNLYTEPFGHTVVGVGYDDSTNSVIIHDTWIINNDWVNVNHTMPWGGSYGNPSMQLSSVSIVNLAPVAAPVAFNKINPSNTGTSTRNVTLSWQASIGADSYFYCIDETPGSTCDTSWTSANSNTSVSAGLLSLGTHYWQVRAHNTIGDTYANGGTWYSFTVAQTLPIFLPLISKPSPPPGNFGKILPVINATGQPTNLTLTWGTSSGVVSYEYCLGTSACTPSSTWTTTGSNTTAPSGPLSAGTTYNWQIRAKNASGYTYADGGNSWTFTTTSPTGSYTTIMSENFEGSFPGSTWDFYDLYNGFSWGKRNCRSYSGSYSGWGVGGGSGASLGCFNDYPTNIYSPAYPSSTWMQYGPFDLTGATAADLSFKLWTKSGNNGPKAADNDALCVYASIDDSDYWGTCWWGDHDWTSGSINLSNVPSLGNFLGKPQVWIAFSFQTNLDTISHGDGGYVDDIVLRKCTASVCTGGAPLSDSANGSVNSGPSRRTRPK